jgi:hAT family C-terminal dimerisation region
MQLHELNERFNEISSELLLCVACLNPKNSFQSFNKDMLIKLASFYPREFENVNTATLGYQLDTYIHDVRLDDRFHDVRNLNDLSKKLVETKKNHVYSYVYLLLKLALLLPVATATVERAFSAMNIIKTKLRNRMCDSWMNYCLITYIEKDMFDKISNEEIMQNYQKMKTRRQVL